MNADDIAKSLNDPKTSFREIDQKIKAMLNAEPTARPRAGRRDGKAEKSKTKKQN